MLARHKLPPASADWKLERRPGGWVIAERRDAAGKVLERHRIQAVEIPGSKMSASLGGALWQVEIATGRDAATGGKADLEAALTAQFPGKVRKILVSAGQSVAEGEKLVLVEAMKMEFAVCAPVAGKVARVLVKDAQQISPGDRFLELEPANGG